MRAAALWKLHEELAPTVEKTRGDREVVPVLVEPLDEPQGVVPVGEATGHVLGTVSVNERSAASRPGRTVPGAAGRTARYSGGVRCPR